MSGHLNRSILTLLMTLFCFSASVQVNAQTMKTYEELWTALKAAEKVQKYQDAEKLSLEIIQKSKSDNNSVEFLKALQYLLKFRTYTEEDMGVRATVPVKTVEAYLKESSGTEKAILQSVLADLYFDYYNDNEYRLYNVTPVADTVKDFALWDISRLKKEIGSLYEASLSDKAALKAVNLKNYEPIIEYKNAKGAFVVTNLYDLLVSKAIAFYSSNQIRSTEVKNAFFIHQNEAFGPVATFVNSSFDTEEQDNFDYRALMHYQNWLKEKIAEKNAAALIVVDVRRLEFVREKFQGSNGEMQFEQALIALRNQYKNTVEEAYPASKLMEFYMARRDIGQKNGPDLVSIRKQCQEIIQKYPGTLGAQNCAVILGQIERKSLSIKGESAVIPGQAFKILTNYKNVAEVNYKIVQLPYDFIPKQNVNVKKTFKSFSKFPVVQSGKQSLKGVEDFNEHSMEIPFKALNEGYYALILYAGSPVSDENNASVQVHYFYATHLSFAYEKEKNEYNIFVFNRENGAQVKNAVVSIYKEVYSNKENKNVEQLVVKDTLDGKSPMNFISPENTYNRYIIKVKNGKDYFESELNPYYYAHVYGSNLEEKDQTVHKIYTDRAIYRPGQTLYYKLIGIQQAGNQFQAFANRNVKVSFRDVNGELIAEEKLITNEFGSVSGSFIIPSNALNGSMTLSSEFGSTDFSVEEYKRPQFEVTFDTIKGQFSLNDTIIVKGKAFTYSGAAVDGALVKYSVSRNGRYPWWCGLYGGYGKMIWPIPGNDKAIADGEIKTNADGTFEIKFKAEPDLSLDKSMKPIFDFTITADVTDISGEIQSGSQSLSVGYLSIDPKVEPAGSWLEKNEKSIRLSIQNLQQQKVPGTFKVKIYALETLQKPMKERLWEVPDQTALSKEAFEQLFPYDEFLNEKEISGRKKGNLLYNTEIKTDGDTLITLPAALLQKGWYLIEASIQDKSGDTITMNVPAEVLLNDGSSVEPKWVDVSLSKSEAVPGDIIKVNIKAALPATHIKIKAGFKGKTFLDSTIIAGPETQTLTLAISNAYIGGIELNYYTVVQNRAYSGNYLIPVTEQKWDDLSAHWKVFRNQLLPGQKEKWTLTIKGLKGDKSAAEVLATMYDASLDVYRKNNYQFNLPIKTFFGYLSGMNSLSSFNTNFGGGWDGKNFGGIYQYRTDYGFPTLMAFGSGQQLYASEVVVSSVRRNVKYKVAGAIAVEAMEAAPMEDKIMFNGNGSVTDSIAASFEPETSPAPIKKPRSNFAETAFFLPQLKTNENGDVVLEFTAPESLTRWNLLGLAHTKDMHYTVFNETVVTAQPLMISANLPRFVHEGDSLYLMAKISNLSETSQSGNASIIIKDAFTEKDITATVLKSAAQIPFTTDAQRSSAVTWKLFIPDGLKAISIEVNAGTAQFTDAEANALPVLNRRQLLTQSLPIWMNKKGKEKFTFDIFQNNASKSLENYSLTFEWASKPLWYVLRALPALNDNDQMTSNALFERYFANAVSAHILQKNPAFADVIKKWKESGEKQSPLQMRQDLKNILIQETPWLTDAAGEEAQQVAILKLLEPESNAATKKKALEELKKLQHGNGGISWAPGMEASPYLTRYVALGFGRLYHLGILKKGEDAALDEMVEKMVLYIDEESNRQFENIKKSDKDFQKKKYMSPDIASILYLRSFFKDIKIKAGNKIAYDYFTEQALKNWTEVNEYSQAMLAIALNKNGQKEPVNTILTALKQKAVNGEEKGIYWKNLTQRSWYWYESPVESHALIAEAFDEAGKDKTTADAVRTWILRQKQSTSWSSSASTAMACYILLFSGNDWVSGSEKDIITVGKEKLSPSSTEAGTGYFSKEWTAAEIKKEQAKIEIQKSGNGPSWGAMYWQFWENKDQIQAAGNEVYIVKKWYRVVNTAAGEQLEPITAASPLKIGDKVRVRLEISGERNLEYVYIKDARPAGLEPLKALSGYTYSNGIGYYSSIKDASTQFFIGYLPRGKFILEYTLMVNNAGTFQEGICTLQCLYAPEFQSNSKGGFIQIISNQQP